MSNGMTHVQQNDTCPTVIPENCAGVKQVLIGWKLIFGYKVQRQQIHHTVERFSTNQNPGYRMSPSIWMIENRSTVRCICCRWTLYPKINFQPIRKCLTHEQIRGMTVGHVSFRWTCIALQSLTRYIPSCKSFLNISPQGLMTFRAENFKLLNSRRFKPTASWTSNFIEDFEG